MTAHEPTAGAAADRDRAAADALRERLLAEHLDGPVKEVFAAHPDMSSMVLMCAQYYNDEADDSVYFRLYPSVRTRPHLGAGAAEYRSWNTGEGDGAEAELPAGFERDIEFFMVERALGASSDAVISAFGAYCIEGSDGDDGDYRPVVLYQRHGDEVTRTFVGVQVRPWADGVRVTA